MDDDADNELFTLATKGELTKPEVVTQVRHAGKSKVGAFARSFIGQWLEISAIGKTIGPDPKRYPEFDVAVQQAALSEPVLYFDYLVRENQSLLKLIDSKETFLNKSLAELYGLSGIEHHEMQLVTLTDSPRRGLLGMSLDGDFLTVADESG